MAIIDHQTRRWWVDASRSRGGYPAHKTARDIFAARFRTVARIKAQIGIPAGGSQLSSAGDFDENCLGFSVFLQVQFKMNRLQILCAFIGVHADTNGEKWGGDIEDTKVLPPGIQ